MSGALVFMSGALMLVAVTKGMPLECLAVMASGACVPESHKTATIRESSQQSATPKALKGSRHTPTLCRIFAHPGASARGVPRGAHV